MSIYIYLHVYIYTHTVTNSTVPCKPWNLKALLPSLRNTSSVRRGSRPRSIASGLSSLRHYGVPGLKDLYKETMLRNPKKRLFFEVQVVFRCV